MTNKERFISICKEHIKRDGINTLLDYLEKTDFYTAPASTKYHLCVEGGLCEHSLNVYDMLKNNHFGLNCSEETYAIVALFHDICKINFYKVDYKNAKNEQCVWEKVPFYAVEDSLPYGHGEKSVYILSGFMKLNRDEAMAINWHMGGFDDRAKGGSFALSTAFEKYPLAVELHIADMRAMYLIEK